MEVIVIAILLGLIPAYIAQGKGKSFGLWWLYGFLIFIVALPHALIMKPDQQSIEKKQISEGMKKCPFLCRNNKEVMKRGVCFSYISI